MFNIPDTVSTGDVLITRYPAWPTSRLTYSVLIELRRFLFKKDATEKWVGKTFVVLIKPLFTVQYKRQRKSSYTVDSIKGSWPLISSARRK